MIRYHTKYRDTIRYDTYLKVQHPGFDLLKAGNRALASIEVITQRAPCRPLPTTPMT